MVNRVNGVVDELDATIREIRSTIFALESRAAAGQSLRADVLRLTDELTEGLGFRPTVRFEGPVDHGVPDHVAPHLLAVVRRRSPTRPATPAPGGSPSTSGSMATWRWRSRTTGWASGGSTRESSLANLRRRAEKLGGTMRLTAPEGGGTRIEWTVPLTG